MNRREFLSNLKAFAMLYGVQSILSENAFAAAAQPERFVSFVIKYTGGTSKAYSEGDWKFQRTLSPLSSFSSDILIPSGLNCDFTYRLNSHASPQVSALSGSRPRTLGEEGISKRRDYGAGTDFDSPSSTLFDYTMGDGKSIDVLIGEKLQQDHGSKLPFLSMTNNDMSFTKLYETAPLLKTSSWGVKGQVIHSIDNIKNLASIIKNQMTCKQITNEVFQRRLAALNFIAKNNQIFSSRNLINKEKFQKITHHTNANVEKTRSQGNSGSSTDQTTCSIFEEAQKLKYSNSAKHEGGSAFPQKMDKMYDLAVEAFKHNITRSITFNLHVEATHGYSHGNLEKLHQTSMKYQTSIASFMNKMKQAGLYNGTLVYCNSGSSSDNNSHNRDNLSVYVVNGGKSGKAGSPSNKKPIGGFLLDILHKYDIKYSQYGGKNHVLGVGKKLNYI